jgi:hypothetical protein
MLVSFPFFHFVAFCWKVDGGWMRCGDLLIWSRMRIVRVVQMGRGRILMLTGNGFWFGGVRERGGWKVSAVFFLCFEGDLGRMFEMM